MLSKIQLYKPFCRSSFFSGHARLHRSILLLLFTVTRDLVSERCERGPAHTRPVELTARWGLGLMQFEELRNLPGPDHLLARFSSSHSNVSTSSICDQVSHLANKVQELVRHSKLSPEGLCLENYK